MSNESKGGDLDNTPPVKPEYNAASDLPAEPDKPQEKDLNYDPPVKTPEPPAPSPTGLSDSAATEVKNHRLEKYRLKKEKQEQEKERKLSRKFNRDRDD